ncbi:Chymotrypsin-C [Pseudolycoriella hygida]|uniref:Chymotrypsin-C n=1 Tax=Pseudolycoriella hygida TaxID=35572 RepID=A0A9Q0MSL3_9DIPT|nr:Chymotrypsin-C [Pseudolycoriella hygida]
MILHVKEILKERLEAKVVLKRLSVPMVRRSPNNPSTTFEGKQGCPQLGTDEGDGESTAEDLHEEEDDDDEVEVIIGSEDHVCWFDWIVRDVMVRTHEQHPENNSCHHELKVSADECGSIQFPPELLIESKQTRKGFWPFAVAIYGIKESRVFCGGSIISKKHILTAGHCVQDRSIGLQYAPSEISVRLEAYVLPVGGRNVNVSEIYIHPYWEEFNVARLDSDIAILLLTDSLTLNQNVQVVCLPSDDDIVQDTIGYVVGWGSENQLPSHSIVNVLENSFCYSLNQTNMRTICGEVETMDSSIREVAGGGLFVSDFASTWVQHGIAVLFTNVTIKEEKYDEPVMFFVNVKSFKIWIEYIVNQTGGALGEAIKRKHNLNCSYMFLYYSYTCVVHDLNLLNKHFAVDTIIGTHISGENSDKVEIIQFHNGTMFSLINGLGKLFPNLKSLYIGYSDSSSLNMKVISRSNFENMKNLFEIVIHKSDIETLPEDTFCELPKLERFQLDGKLKKLPENIFQMNPRLKEVYLASNALQKLPRHLFKNNTLLDWVNFSNNLIKIIEIDFSQFANVRYVFLDGNVCINKNFIKTEILNENLYQETNAVGKVMELQRLIYNNCSFFP